MGYFGTVIGFYLCCACALYEAEKEPNGKNWKTQALKGNVT